MSPTRRLHPALRVENEVHIAHAKARTHRFLKSETHVIVGDHEPELRADVRAAIAEHGWKLDAPTPISMIAYGPGFLVPAPRERR